LAAVTFYLEHIATLDAGCVSRPSCEAVADFLNPAAAFAAHWLGAFLACDIVHWQI